MATTEPIAPIRIAEIARATAEKIEAQGWCQGKLFNPLRGTLSARGASAIVCGIPPIAPMLFSPMRRNELAWREWNAVDSALGDYLGIPHGEACACGADHDNRASYWEDEPGRTAAEVCAALRGLADHQDKLADLDHGLTEIDWDISSLFKPQD